VQFIENTFFDKLENGTVPLPDGPIGPNGPQLVDVPIAQLGISYPVVTTENRIVPVTFLPDALDENTSGRATLSTLDRGATGVDAAAADPDAGPKEWKLRRYDFTIQFLWQPKTRSERNQPPAANQGEASPETASVDGTGTSAG